MMTVYSPKKTKTHSPKRENRPGVFLNVRFYPVCLRTLCFLQFFRLFLRAQTMIRRSLVSLKVAQPMGARFASRWTAEKVPMGPADPILGLNEAYAKVRRPVTISSVTCHKSVHTNSQVVDRGPGISRRTPTPTRSTSVLAPTVATTASPGFFPPSRL